MSGNLDQAIIDGLGERSKCFVVSAVKHLLFNKAPKPFDEIEIRGVGWKVKEFNPQRRSLLKY